MNVAILHEGGREVRITAEEYYSRFGARGGHSTWLTCPECGQPVVTRAMTPYSLVSPYLKHESDNPVAWGCMNYRADGESYGWSEPDSVSLGDPESMYLEQMAHGEYLLMASFPPMEPWALEYLQEQGARISFGIEEYEVNHENFSTDTYVFLYYEVDGPSFGLGLGIHGAEWPYDAPLPNIEHTLNGCMLFEALDTGNMAERLSTERIDSYDGSRFILVFSTVDGMVTARLIEGISTRFRVTGVIVGSEEGGKELRVAYFTTNDREALKSALAWSRPTQRR